MITFAPLSLGPGARGGVAGPPWSFTSGAATTPELATQSRLALAATLDVVPTALRFVSQVHGARVVVVPGEVEGPADGMITSEPGLYLCLGIADCCAVLVHDPVRRAVGAFHAGWRGARDRIVATGLGAMTRVFSSRPPDLRVYLSPCASGERYVVGPEVAALFPRSLGRTERGEVTLDLRTELVGQLTALGVPRASIEVSEVCTLADPRCHSHRRDADRAGRMAAFIGLAG